MLIRRRREREFDLLASMFGGEEQEVTVTAANRAQCFTAAVLGTSDPNNVYSVTLLRDAGRELDPYETGGGVEVDDPWPRGARYRGGDLYDESPRHRVYHVGLELFSGVDTVLGVYAPSRAASFTAAVIYSATPDDIRLAHLSIITAKPGDSPASTEPSGEPPAWYVNPVRTVMEQWPATTRCRGVSH